MYVICTCKSNTGLIGCGETRKKDATRQMIVTGNHKHAFANGITIKGSSRLRNGIIPSLQVKMSDFRRLSRLLDPLNAGFTGWLS